MHRHLRLTSAWLVGCAVAFTGLASPQPGLSADNSVRDVSYAKHGDAFELSVASNATVTTRVSRFSVDAKSDIVDLVVDVSPASYDGQTKVIGFSKGQLQQVRVGQLSQDPAVMRIVIESTGSPKYDLTNAAGHQLKLAVATSQVAFALPAQEAVAAAQQAKDRHDTAFSTSGAVATAGSQAHTATVAKVQAPQPVAHAAAPTHAAVVASAAKPKLAVTSTHAAAYTHVAVAHASTTHVVAKAALPARPATPVVVAVATPNPWLPGGKYYCKVGARTPSG